MSGCHYPLFLKLLEVSYVIYTALVQFSCHHLASYLLSFSHISFGSYILLSLCWGNVVIPIHYMPTFAQQWQSGKAETEPTQPAELQVFITWPFTEKVG